MLWRFVYRWEMHLYVKSQNRVRLRMAGVANLRESEGETK
jgi:hypothetical protein